MPRSSPSERHRAALLVPFLYAYLTRMKGARGFVFNAATLWGPGLILTAGLGGMGPAGAVPAYAGGYLAFICLYELGYLANDSWGLRHDSTPRRRLGFAPSPGFAAAFVAIRIAVVLALAAWWGGLAEGWFWVAVGALVAAMLAHNLLVREEFKPLTFFQMSTLRFATPVVLATGGAQAPAVLAAGMLLFVFPRLLTYLDAKDRLRLPERRAPGFALGLQLLAAPLVAVLAWAAGSWAVVLAWAWLLVFAGAVALAGRMGRLPERPADATPAPSSPPDAP